MFGLFNLLRPPRLSLSLSLCATLPLRYSSSRLQPPAYSHGFSLCGKDPLRFSLSHCFFSLTGKEPTHIVKGIEGDWKAGIEEGDWGTKPSTGRRRRLESRD
ncbi:uncharacterized protein LOC112202002 [Rosa chinensis]|uniref:uncharacterized protein LOC112202002 n=1 Tax=Rosa chinensis TaxID=74649 RepID=UPI001AD9056A|nr:uncharacterized protein LOC112202002 [Rosa chinensis]